MTSYKPWRACVPACVLLLLIIAPTVFARADDLPKGTIIERVVCESDAAQSYALYLPSAYTPQKKWPVIYAFDPGARGNIPVKLYRDVAEKYGYIVAGSYNSQNGMQSAPLQAAISAMIGDTRKRFSIDEKRVYTTGFSGGARVATRVASSCRGCVAGVIACGAGFPSDIKPTEATPFVFYGTVGVDDFNYPELKRLEDKLSALKIPNHIATFEGEHRWASSQLLMEAAEWMELQAMRAGRRVRDDALIEALWKKRVEQTGAVVAAGNAYEAYVSYAALAADFKDLKDVGEFEKKATTLNETKEVKQGLRKEQEQLREQQDIADRLIHLGARLLAEPSHRAAARNELKTAVEGLRKRAQTARDSSESLVVRRALQQVSAQTFEAALYNYLPNRQYEVAIANLLVAEEVTPGLVRIPYELARAYALSGDKKMALEALRRAIEKGLTDPTIIENQKDFDGLRNENEYKVIVNELKQPRTSK